MKTILCVKTHKDLTNEVIETYLDSKNSVLCCDDDKERMILINDLNSTIMEALVAEMSPRKRRFTVKICSLFMADLLSYEMNKRFK